MLIHVHYTERHELDGFFDAENAVHWLLVVNYVAKCEVDIL